MRCFGCFRSSDQTHLAHEQLWIAERKREKRHEAKRGEERKKRCSIVLVRNKDYNQLTHIPCDDGVELEPPTRQRSIAECSGKVEKV